MKILLVIISICLLFCVSCSKSSSPSTITSIAPDMSTESWLVNYNYVIGMEYVYEVDGESGETQAIIWINNSHYQHFDPTLKINGVTCEGDDWESDENGIGTYYYYNIDLPQLVPNSQLNYEFTTSDTTLTGTIILPSQYHLTYPLFDFNTNFVLNWTLENMPDNQRMFAYLGYYDESDFMVNTKLRNSVRSYTFNKDLFVNCGICITDLSSYKFTHNADSLLVYGATTDQKFIELFPGVKQFDKKKIENKMRKEMMRNLPFKKE